jgi:hypothetical protein
MNLVVHCKKSSYDVYIGRPSIWGNPFSHLPNTLAIYKVKTRDDAIMQFEKWLINQPDLVAECKKELKGKTLGCWCHPKPCHGDVLARIANAL